MLATVKQGASEVAVDASGNVIAASATGITQNGNAGVDTSQARIALQNKSVQADDRPRLARPPLSARLSARSATRSSTMITTASAAIA